MIPQEDIQAFQTKILSWYALNKRDLPWRKTKDPYKILVSEIMLQQTQVSRVIPKYKAWLQAFPTVTALAHAKTSEVLRLWSGLGYNRRALYLQKAAKKIVTLNHVISIRQLAERDLGEISHSVRNDNKIHFPQTIEELKKLPGIGEYTAAAVACFAFNAQVVVIDTNIRKVIIVHFPVMLNSFQHLKVSAQHSEIPKQVRDDNIKIIAQQLLPVGRASEWNQALMDYASLMLKKEKIPLVKQSKFKDSNRYYRGQIIKLLLQDRTTTTAALVNLFHIDATRLEKIVVGMEKDGLIKKKGNIIVFSSH